MKPGVPFIQRAAAQSRLERGDQIRMELRDGEMAPSCSIKGCGRPTVTRGWCRRHYWRWRTHGNPLAGGTSIGAPAAFLAVAEQYAGDDCLIWPFAKTHDGYGHLQVDGKTQTANVIVCEVVHGPRPTHVMKSRIRVEKAVLAAYLRNICDGRHEKKIMQISCCTAPITAARSTTWQNY